MLLISHSANSNAATVTVGRINIIIMEVRVWSTLRKFMQQKFFQRTNEVLKQPS